MSVLPYLTAPTLGAANTQTETIEVLGIEVVQSIQRLDNSVPLIANKETLIRVYIDWTSVSNAVTVTAEIAWNAGGAESYLPIPGVLLIDPSTQNSIQDQRRDLSVSFNVRLPESATHSGATEFRVSKLNIIGRGNANIAGNKSVKVNFEAAPPLRIRAIGLRYRDGSRTLTPESRHFSYLRSFLTRAFPTSEVHWSQLVVDANFSPPFDSSTPVRANAQLAALRAREVSQGVDRRTHYIGLVDDDNGANFMRGRASGIPGAPSPDTVCSSPVGTPNGFAGDHDDSYADWYGAHELGHTYGRYHPGFPPGSQDSSDQDFPYPNGRISGEDQRLHVGLDLGDQSLGIRERILDSMNHHDIMTYADKQWVSEYTFLAILNRLRQEDAL